MKTLKTNGLVAGLLLACGVARAQQTTTTTTDSAAGITVYRVVTTTPPPNPLLTAEDSARERARLANAERLRREATTRPAKVPTNVPLSPMTGEAPELARPVEPSPEEVARIRDQQRREMLNHALSKKGKKQTKETTHTIKHLRKAAAREAEAPAPRAGATKRD